MNLLVKDKCFYKKMAVIAIPISLQSMITIGVNMTDTVMVGKLGETSLSATALAKVCIPLEERKVDKNFFKGENESCTVN
jgi:Na+-driven multidrug efflux pump